MTNMHWRQTSSINDDVMHYSYHCKVMNGCIQVFIFNREALLGMTDSIHWLQPDLQGLEKLSQDATILSSTAFCPSDRSCNLLMLPLCVPRNFFNFDQVNVSKRSPAIMMCMCVNFLSIVSIWAAHGVYRRPLVYHKSCSPSGRGVAKF